MDDKRSYHGLRMASRGQPIRPLDLISYIDDEDEPRPVSPNDYAYENRRHSPSVASVSVTGEQSANQCSAAILLAAAAAVSAASAANGTPPVPPKRGSTLSHSSTAGKLNDNGGKLGELAPLLAKENLERSRSAPFSGWPATAVASKATPDSTGNADGYRIRDDNRLHETSI